MHLNRRMSAMGRQEPTRSRPAVVPSGQYETLDRVTNIATNEKSL